MKKKSSVYGRLIVSIVLLQLSNAYSSEKTLVANVTAGAVYNDNIFLTEQPRSVVGLVVTPSLKGIIKEQNWQASLDARLRVNDYSDENLDSTEQLFTLAGRYGAQRNIFSLNISHSQFSSLSTYSGDFGTVKANVLRKTQKVSPQYTRVLTERANLSFTYGYTDVDFTGGNTGLIPYYTQSGSVSLQYSLTQTDNVSISLQVVDYESKNKLITYQLFTSQLAISHKFSQTLSTNLSVGVSRRNSTNISTRTIDFFGNVIVLQQEIDAENRGLIYNANISKRLEAGQVGGGLSRNNSSNSFGGLDEVDRLQLNYSKSLSSQWRYGLSASVASITSVSSNSAASDRDILFFNSAVYYTVSRDWNINASYSFSQRKFKSDTSEGRVPHSNRVFIGLTYNFPQLATF